MTAPTIKIASPVDGGVFTRGETVIADFSCADNQSGSGIKSCGGTVPEASAIHTSTIGRHVFVVEPGDHLVILRDRVAGYRLGSGLWSVRIVVTDSDGNSMMRRTRFVLP